MEQYLYFILFCFKFWAEDFYLLIQLSFFIFKQSQFFFTTFDIFLYNKLHLISVLGKYNLIYYFINPSQQWEECSFPIHWSVICSL